MDIQELKKSTELAIQYFDSNEKSQLKGHEVARALCSLTLDYVNEGIALNKIYFDYREIYRQVWGQDANSAKASQMVRKHISLAQECFDSNSQLNEFILENEAIPIRFVTEVSKGGRRTQDSISLNVNTNDQITSIKDPNFASYQAVQLPKVYWITKPFINMTLRPKALFIISIFLVVFAVVGMLSILGFFTWDSQVVLASLALAFLLSGYLLLKLVEIMNVGVTTLPIFLAPLTTRNAMLVLDKERDKNDIRLKMKAIVYECNCPICGDHIIIEKSKEFKGRYVGKCAVAPSEHVFSFDHVTKKGKFLR